MNQKISTLMDGEMNDEEAVILLGRIKNDSQGHNEWMTYHLIGDVMRQSERIPKNLDASFYARLHAEPTILAPQPGRESRTKYFAMSAVASIMAMAFLAWLSVQVDGKQSDQQSQKWAQQMPASISVSSPLVNDGINDYLLAHHEYSPSTDVRGASSYIHTVSFANTGAGR